METYLFRRLSGLGISLALTLVPLPVLAGSATAESVWDQQSALERARQQMPPGTTASRERCEEVEVGVGNPRYRCTVEWHDTVTP